jgi:predicted kinase
MKSAERRNNTAERLVQNNPPILKMAWLTTLAEVTADPLGAIWIRPEEYRAATTGTRFDAERATPAGGYRRQSEREAWVETKIKKRCLLTE